MTWAKFISVDYKHFFRIGVIFQLLLFFPFDVNRLIQFAYQPAATGTFLLIEGILDKGKAGGR